LIKLADRLNNMRTLSAQPPEKQKRIALETLEIFAPLADRLGIGKIKRELEDLSFQYLMTGEYTWLINQVKDQYEQREKYLEKIIPVVKKELLKEEIKPLEIHWRAKNYYSLYRKLKRYEMNLNRIYDLVALRIIVPTIEDCYATLGVIHKTWRPLPGRVKDYIALPKPNGYQSLHTTVFCDGGKITEVQIRTPQMHEEAERGIAAHWFYSEQKGIKAYLKRIFRQTPQKEIAWIKQLQKWQEETQESPEEFMRSLKIDFFKDRIFVFTPKGDVIDLPEGATPIDFAYNIHSDVGNRCQGAKVDGRMVALDAALQNGQVVEIIKNKNAKPNRDWLKFAKTSQAQNKIRQWLNKNQKDFWDEKIKKEETPKTIQPKTVFAPSAKILKPEAEVAGDPKIAAQLAKCCRPQPPDAIAGYITLNQRITVHRKDCKNLQKLKDPSRLVSAVWKTKN
ncbi:MAG: TGS domain-containing protein, partial [Candidatus Portnoybacteria bacterium]|nr:TGS domain-containing protein [Candidatus Portnoybacteria bacterium]